MVGEARGLIVRRYGDRGPLVIVLHGGPGAPGYMAPVARGLAADHRVLEPFQRASGGAPLTVARHVEDLHQLLGSPASAERPALVGSSWGAMLALAYAAAHPRDAGPLVLVGCGTFDLVARRRMRQILDQRMRGEPGRAFARLDDIADPAERNARRAALLDAVYSYQLVEDDHDDDPAACDDERARHETWDDMVRQQELGVYPAAFAAIDVPVLMLHGAVDPHPGALIRDSLTPWLPQLAYHEWQRCGHYPWREAAVRDDFFARLRAWLARPTPGRARRGDA